MEYFKINKDSINQPTTGGYREWKQPLADEGKYQCVYCSIPDKKFGGLRNFHVEHYKPKSIFPNLKDDWLNLFLACSICNCFKSNDWPNEPDTNLSYKCYPKPNDIDYSQIFSWSESSNYLLEGTNIAARYMVIRLYLNRPQLILERQEFTILRKIIIALAELELLLIDLCKDETKDNFLCELTKQIVQSYKNFIETITLTYSPYTLEQITKI